MLKRNCDLALLKQRVTSISVHKDLPRHDALYLPNDRESR